MPKKRNFARPVRIVAKRPGKLGGPGYLKKSAMQRHRLLDRCKDKYGYRSCLGSIQALEVWLKNSGTASELGKLRADRAWLVRNYGAKKNPRLSSSFGAEGTIGKSERSAIARDFWKGE